MISSVNYQSLICMKLEGLVVIKILMRYRGELCKTLKNLILAYIQEEKLCNEKLIHSNWCINETMPSHTRFSLSGNIYTAGGIPLCLEKQIL